MKLKDHIDKRSKAELAQALHDLLSGYCSPSFGSLPKKEIDLLMLNALTDVGFVKKHPTAYELVSSLRVTRTKARNLIYEQELRRHSVDSLNELVKDALRRPLIQKQQDLFALEIDNPLVIDHLRSILREEGHAADGSFSASMVRVNADGLVAAIGHFLTDKEKKDIKERLIKAGVPDGSFSGVVKAVLKKAAATVAEDAGKAVLDSVSDYVSPLLDKSFGKVASIATGLFRKAKSR